MLARPSPVVVTFEFPVVIAVVGYWSKASEPPVLSSYACAC